MPTSNAVLITGYGRTRLFRFNLTLPATDANEYFVSAALMLLQRFGLKFMLAGTKVCLGDDWILGCPLQLFILELGSVALLAPVSVSDVTFWVVLVAKESNALLRNLGVYQHFSVRVRCVLNRPLSDDQVAEMNNTRRRVVAPCDNLAEMATPIAVIIATVLSEY